MKTELEAADSVEQTHNNLLTYVIIFFFLLTFGIKAFTDQLFSEGQVSSTIAYSKYVTAALACIATFIQMQKTGEHLFIKEFNYLIIICVLFSFESLFLCVLRGTLSFYVAITLIRLIMPIILAYGILNSLTQRQIYFCIVASLFICVLGYIFNLIRDGVSLSSIMQVDFALSRSPTEDSGFALISFLFAVYFLYFHTNLFLPILSVIFCLLTFKRINIVICLIAVIIACFFPNLMDKHISLRIRTICKWVTVFLITVWYWLLLPQQQDVFKSIFKQPPAEFTQGRSTVMNYVLNSNFRSYGFGSSMDLTMTNLNVPFEMDLIRIGIELSPVVLFIFIWLYWNIAGNKFWGYFVVGFLMLTMIMTDCLGSNFDLILAYILLGQIGQGRNIHQLIRPKAVLYREKEESNEYLF